MERHFTVEEADALLPLLKVRIEQLQDVQKKIEAAWTELDDSRQRKVRREGGVLYLGNRAAAEARLRHRVNEANGIISKIHKMGCLLKDVDLGLIDFPAYLDGKEVYLCWRLGEPRIRYYHETDQGYSGRRLLPKAKHQDEDDPQQPNDAKGGGMNTLE